MLNEVFLLDQALARCGVAVSETHPWVKKLKKGDGIIVGLGTDGLIKTIEYLDPSRAPELSNITPSNHKMFPAINLFGPIWKLPVDSELVTEFLTQKNRSDARKRLEIMTRLIENAELAYSPKDLERLKSLIDDFPRSELKPRFPQNQPEFAAFPELLARLAKHSYEPEEFLRQLTKMSLEACRNARLNALELIEAILFGKWNAKTRVFQKTSKTLVFDLADCPHYRYRVADPRMGTYFSQSLGNSEPRGSSLQGVCSLTGETMEMEIEKLPSPRLPVLADTYLMSMNEDAPCQFRYGLISTQIFPVGRKTARNLNKALLQITTPDKKGRTWTAIPSFAPKKQDLLIVYLEDRPVTAIMLASFFAEPLGGDEMAEELFEQTTKTVCDALRGEPSVHRSSLLRLMVLTKIDKGRAQVAFSETYSVSRILDAAEEWQSGAKNRPEIRILIPGRKRGEKALWQEPTSPSPASVQRCLRIKWVRSGANKCDVDGPALSDIYSALLDQGKESKAVAEKLLERTLTLTLPLLLGLSHAQRLGQNTISYEGRRTSLTAISLLSILLHKLGYRKENFMEESFFLVGRLFSLADTLHKEYCKIVRKGKIPPQLIGNSLIAIAMENPERGITRLFERLRIYQAWAQTATGDKIGLAKWALSQIGRIADGLGHQSILTSADSAAKAKMALGYLAWGASEVAEQEQ